MIRCEKARPKDAATLAHISERAFHSDIHCGATGLGGPPGYKSDEWQKKMMRIGDYYKILVGDQMVGGLIVFRKKPREYELGRIFVDPDYQNQGVGTQAVEFLWEEYPLAKRWTLGTPAWNRRTRYFYKKVGFVRWGQTSVVESSLRRGCLPGEWHGHRKTECQQNDQYQGGRPMDEKRAKIVSVNADNVDEEGFFCYKSKPKSAGYQEKLVWLKQRFAEGIKIKILYEGQRSVGFVEYIPGEFAWRAVEAEGYLVVHCIWVVGRGKKKGHGSRLLNECVEDAREMGKHGVAMVTSSGNWLAGKKLFLKNGFEVVDQAPPSFELLVKRFDDAAPLPAFPQDWDERASRYAAGLTVVYADQCPYINDAVKQYLELAEERGVEARVIKLTSSREVRDAAPSPYGVFNVVYDGRLVTYHYMGRKEKQALIELWEG